MGHKGKDRGKRGGTSNAPASESSDHAITPTRSSQASAASLAPTLVFVPPDTVICGQERMRAGGVVFRLLHALFTSPRHRLSSAELCAKVWGRKADRDELKAACRMAMNVLSGLGASEAKLVMEDDAVVVKHEEK